MAFNLLVFDICTVCLTIIKPCSCIYFVPEYLSVQANMEHGGDIIYNECVSCRYPGMFL